MIGICVVYLFADERADFLACQSIQKLKEYTEGEYRIYGCAPRASEQQIQALSDLGVVLLPAREVPGNPHPSWNSTSAEHSCLIDGLVSRAFEDGCAFAAAFDMDSWPVVSGWDGFYSRLLSEAIPVAAIVRTEFSDNFPFGAFTIVKRSFWRPGHSSFAGDLDHSRSRRPWETGSGILDQLAREEKTFLRLERTNAWNPHPIVAGVYDDAFFHLGAGSRTTRFISDEQQYALNGSETRRRFADEMNMAFHRTVIEMLREDHDAFIKELAGGELVAFEPIPTPAANIPPALSLTDRSMRAPRPRP
jgi:hypothetical protein